MSRSRLSRRAFLGRTAQYGSALLGSSFLINHPELFGHLLGLHTGRASANDSLSTLLKSSKRARYWVSTQMPEAACGTCHGSTTTNQKKAEPHVQVYIRCQLCSQQCMLAPGKRGRCRTRINYQGELRTLVYGRPISVHVDPIEKKPFYHFLPGSSAFSLATSGCPLRCKFCQNWEISQARPEDYSSRYFAPNRMADQAHNQESEVIAFTYNEPTVFTEYLIDIARAAKPKGLKSVLVSCGFMMEKPLTDMCRVLDGIKIDLKGFSTDFYHKVCQAELKPVLRSIKQVSKSGTHLEIVNLVVPTLNDSDTMLKNLANFVANEVGPDVPLHFTRFHPDYQMRNLPPTPPATLERARDIALDKGLHYVYVGNLPGHPGNHTYCPKCGKVIIERRGFFTQNIHIKKGMCTFCKEKIAGIWS